MRNLILAAVLTAAMSPTLAADIQACRDAGDFTLATARARDAGVTEPVLQVAMRETIGAEDQALYTKLIHLTFTARNGSPRQLERDVRQSCIKGAWYK